MRGIVCADLREFNSALDYESIRGEFSSRDAAPQRTFGPPLCVEDAADFLGELRDRERLRQEIDTGV